MSTKKEFSAAPRQKSIYLSRCLTKQLLFIIGGATCWKPESGSPISKDTALVGLGTAVAIFVVRNVAFARTGCLTLSGWSLSEFLFFSFPLSTNRYPCMRCSATSTDMAEVVTKLDGLKSKANDKLGSHYYAASTSMAAIGSTLT